MVGGVGSMLPKIARTVAANISQRVNTHTMESITTGIAATQNLKRITTILGIGMSMSVMVVPL
jgi:hypothetical protein